MIIYIDYNFNNILKMIDRIGFNNIENILVYDDMYSHLKEKIPFSVSSQQYRYLTYLHRKYIDFLVEKENKFANYLKQHSYREVYMPSNAFTEKHLSRLYQFIDENNENTIIFRWSHVLTIVRENLEHVINLKKLNIDENDMAEYLFGTIERIDMLREMFRTLHSKNISIFIVINYQNILILKWIRYLYPSFNESNLIWSNSLMPCLPVANPKSIICT